MNLSLIHISEPTRRTPISYAVFCLKKKCKYKDLELEIQRMWHMKTVVIPMVVGALGTVKKGYGRKHQESIRES